MTLLEVKVRAGAKTQAIEYQADGSFKIRVTAAPEKGKANKAVLNLLAEFLSVPKSSLEIISGETSSNKKIRMK